MGLLACLRCIDAGQADGDGLPRLAHPERVAIADRDDGGGSCVDWQLTNPYEQTGAKQGTEQKPEPFQG